MALPDGVQYGTVSWTAVAPVADGADVDGLPDAVPVAGTVTFTPSATVLLATGDAPVTVLSVPVTYTLDADGVLRDSQGRAQISLVATDSAGLNPTGWTWRADYRLSPVDGQAVQRGSFSFALPAGTNVDLTTVAPVASSNGVAIIRGEKGDPGSAYPLVTGDAGDTAIAGLVEDDASATSGALRAAFETEVNDGDFTPTGAWDWTGATVTGLSGGGGGAVDSVNGQTGVVVLDAADVGAAPASAGVPAGGTSSTFLRGDGTWTSPAASETVQNVTASTATTPISIASGSVVNLALNANTTLSLSTPAAGQSFTLQVTQGGTNTLAFGSNVKWSGGTVPAVSSGAGKIDAFTFFSVDGVNWLGGLVGKAFA